MYCCFKKLPYYKNNRKCEKIIILFFHIFKTIQFANYNDFGRVLQTILKAIFMKIIKLLFFILIGSEIFFFATVLSSSSIFIPLPVGQYLPTQYHKLVEKNFLKKVFCSNFLKNITVDANVSYRYMQTINGNQIATNLWGNNSLFFEGSSVQNRNSNSLIAEYFGMAPDTNIILNLSPKIVNQILDFQISLNKEKLWFQINFPLIATKNILNWYTNGNLGIEKIDGATVNLVNNQLNNPNVNNPCTATMNGLSITPIYQDAYQFNNSFNATGNFVAPSKDYSEQTFVSVAQTNVNVGTDNDYNVITNSTFEPIAPNIIGTINMGNYGKISYSGATEIGIGTPNLVLETDLVLPAVTIESALGGYTFGKVKTRKKNLFNFNICPDYIFGLYDIPFMIGYDFFKFDLFHLGAYLKCVLPTGTKINDEFLTYVFSPVIGNGHFLEIGGGFSTHGVILDENRYSVSLFGDGYVTKMFSYDKQVRSFDVLDQPMSRYALVYPIFVQNGQYEVKQDMILVGDINLYRGNVSAVRGELILDLILQYNKNKIGLGYSFSGKTQENVNCGSTIDLKNYGFVGNALQYVFGVGPIANSNGLGQFIDVPCGQYMAGNAEGQASNINFFYLGQSNLVSDMDPGENAAYSYGFPLLAKYGKIGLPDIENNFSGLMKKQVLNRVFMHFDYESICTKYTTYFSLLGSLGFQSALYPTATYYDIAVKVGFNF